MTREEIGTAALFFLEGHGIPSGSGTAVRRDLEAMLFAAANQAYTEAAQVVESFQVPNISEREAAGNAPGSLVGQHLIATEAAKRIRALADSISTEGEK
jgi:hypothetical protein